MTRTTAHMSTQCAPLGGVRVALLVALASASRV